MKRNADAPRTPAAELHAWALSNVFPRGIRHAGREWALQFLFQSEFNRGDSLESSLALFWEEHDLGFAADLKRFEHVKGALTDGQRKEVAKLHRQGKRFAEVLIRGILAIHEQLDERIAEASKNWGVDRMGTVDRNILRIGAYEILERDDIPPVATINEAVDLAKTFSSLESGRFVNGILDHLLKGTGRDPRGSTKKPPETAPGAPGGAPGAPAPGTP